MNNYAIICLVLVIFLFWYSQKGSLYSVRHLEDLLRWFSNRLFQGLFRSYIIEFSKCMRFHYMCPTCFLLLYHIIITFSAVLGWPNYNISLPRCYLKSTIEFLVRVFHLHRHNWKSGEMFLVKLAHYSTPIFLSWTWIF